MNKQEMYLSAKDRYTKAVSEESTRQIREKVIESIRFVRIPGAQWEGSTFAGTELLEQLDKYPRFELNKVAKEIDRIISEYRKNKLTVKFRPADSKASKDLAEKLNKAFRADWVRSNGDAAAINCFDDAVTGGMGAIELCAEYENEEDPLDERMKITFKPVFDSQSCVFWDPNAKEYDKSDAEWCGLSYTMTPEAYKAKYDKAAPSSVEKIETGQWQDWWTPDAVTICRWFEVRTDKIDVIAYKNPFTLEQSIYYSDEIADIEDELLESGFLEVARRQVKKKRVYCGIFDGEGWLEEPKRIPGSLIPVCMQYGKRWFIDNVERIEGHATKAMDAQRLDNLMVSMLADTATQGNESTPIVDIDQISGLERVWANRNKTRPAYLPLKSIKDKQGNIIAAANVSGYTQPPQVSPALATLLQYTGAAIQEITGASNMQSLPSNLAEDTVESIFSRADMQSYIYMDNAAATMRYVGKVWLSMAKEVYGSSQELAMQDEEGNRTFGDLSAGVVDRQTGKTVMLNDLATANFDVEVDIGESFTAKRDAVRRDLLNLLGMMQPDNPYYPVIMAKIVDNSDGDGLEELQRFNRKLMLQNGIAKPEEEDAELMQEIQAEEQAQQPPVDPNVLLAQAEMQKAAVAEQKNQMEYQKWLMEYELRRVELELKGVEIGSKVELQSAQTFKYNQEAMSNAQTQRNQPDL